MHAVFMKFIDIYVMYLFYIWKLFKYASSVKKKTIFLIQNLIKMGFDLNFDT